MRRRVAIAGLRLALPLLCGASAARADGCPTTGADAVVLSATEPRLDLRLADGRRVRLVGIEAAAGTPSDPAGADSAQAGLAGLLKGHPLSIALVSERPDRWGRIAAWAFAGTATPGGVATAAVAAGLARYRPEPDATPCRAELLAAEARKLDLQPIVSILTPPPMYRFGPC